MDVGTWLRNLGLGQYESSFRENEIDSEAGSDILDPDGDDVTATKLAVDSEVEHGKVPRTAFDLEFRPDRPDVLGAQRGLCSGHLALIPRYSLKGRAGRVHLILHGHTPRLERARSMSSGVGTRSAFGLLRTSHPARRRATGSE